MKKRKKIHVSILMAVITAFLIIGIPMLVINKGDNNPGDLDIQIDMSGLQPLQAAYNDSWDGVRFIATAVKLINANIESFMRALNATGAISNSLTGTWTGTYTNPATGNSFTYKLGLNQNYTATNSVDGTTKTYNHGYQLCNGSTQAYQIFFDSVTDPGSEDGLLLIYRPEQFATFFTGSGAANVVVEFMLTGTAGERTEVMSWTGGPLFLSGTVTDARVFVTEADSGNQINFYGAAKLNSGHCSGGPDYYALAFIAKTAAPNNSTGKWGINNAIPTTDQLCGTTANPTTYGTFSSANTDGLVEQGVAASAIPAGYPTAADVDTLFSGISTNTYLEKADIDGLSGAISFSSALTCP